jgi:hypothetical protein
MKPKTAIPGSSCSRGDHRQAKGRGKGRDDKRPVREGSNASGGVKQDDICRYCGKKGHWAHECRKKKREEAHLAQIERKLTLRCLFAKYELDVVPPTSSAPALDVPVGAVVFLNEEKAKMVPGREDKPVDSIWYLDTGASNHMTGDRASFTELDEAITRNMRFVDSLVVQIMGCGTITFSIDGGP